MSTPVEQIKERLGIVDVVSSYLKLDKAGASLKAKCPFHNEKTPSFFVSPARNSYYCFGCGAKGDIFTFVQEFEGLDFVGALRVLASRAGVTLTKIDPKVRSQYARLYLLLEKATRFFESQLEGHSEAKEYLHGRALSDDARRAWRLGFAPDEWRALSDALLKDGFTPEEMEKVGLAKRARAEDGSPKQGERYYDAFRGRIMFPILDSASRVIAFSGRILPRLDDGKTGKYINSPETALFQKSQVLHGFHLAKLAIRQKDATILVEGQMDLLMAHQAGFQNTVASSGTALTKEQLLRIKRLSENLLLAFDSDAAGLKAAERAIQLALSLGMNVKVIPLEEKDPADLIAKDREAWDAAVRNAPHVIEFLLSKIQASPLEAREKALRIERALLPLLRMLPSQVEQSHFVKRIADTTGLREEALWETLKKLKSPEPLHGETQPRAPTKRTFTLERRIFGALFSFETNGDGANVSRLEHALRALFADSFQKRREEHEKEKDLILTEYEAFYGERMPESEERELLRNLEEEHLEEMLARMMEALAQAEREGKRENVTSLLESCKKLGERLSALKAARFSK